MRVAMNRGIRTHRLIGARLDRVPLLSYVAIDGNRTSVAFAVQCCIVLMKFSMNA